MERAAGGSVREIPKARCGHPLLRGAEEHEVKRRAQRAAHVAPGAEGLGDQGDADGSGGRLVKSVQNVLGGPQSACNIPLRVQMCLSDSSQRPVMA